jgi:hypothetical protein
MRGEREREREIDTKTKWNGIISFWPRTFSHEDQTNPLHRSGDYYAAPTLADRNLTFRKLNGFRIGSLVAELPTGQDPNPVP